MGAQMALSLIGDIGAFASQSIEARMAGKLQAYRNTMSALSAARSKNAVTVNEIGVRDAEINAQTLIQQTSMQDLAKAKVSAASAGVAGNSVDLAVADLKASAGKASYAQSKAKNSALREMGAQRTSIDLAQLSNKDIQVIPKPSVGALLLGAGTNLLNTYDNNQPEGDRLLE